MWDYDGYIAKAKLFNSRAESYSDDGFALWLLLGLECLQRAPLARIHASLLAEPNGDSILHANGIEAPGDPKTVALTTVLKRLEAIVKEFPNVKAEANRLINLRNGELHSSATVLADIEKSDWLGAYYEVVKVIVEHLDIPIGDVLPESVVKQAAEYAAASRTKIKIEVARRVEQSKTMLSLLTASDVTARLTTLYPRAVAFPESTYIPCPVCSNRSILETAVVRVTRDRYNEGDDVIERDFVSIAKNFLCVVCELELHGVHEVEAAGLASEYVETVVESLADRYSEQFYEPDYGND